jgi:hypothetical protein
MKRSVFHFGFWQFQQIVAWLLLVTFVPIAILREGAHLLPGMGTCCQSSDYQSEVDSSHCYQDSHNHHSHDQNSHNHYFHNHNSHQQQNSHQSNSDYNPVDVCVVCEFCSLFNSTGIVPKCFLETAIVSAVEFIELGNFSGEFFSLFLARAPPFDVSILAT